jgi:hypothetical protein
MAKLFLVQDHRGVSMPLSFVRPMFLAPVGPIVAVAMMAQPASAAVWGWGCMGRLGSNQVIFNRNNLVVVPARSVRVKLVELGEKSSKPLSSDSGLGFNADDGNSGFERTITFTSEDNPARKLRLTEISSQKISERKGRIGPRDEITTKFRKTYDYVLGREPKRRIRMDCIEYILTTKGGRQE